MNAPGGPEPQIDDLFDVLYEASQFYRQQLATSWVPGYLAGRGIPRHAQLEWEIGYAPGRRDALTRHLRPRGFPDPVIVAAGLARKSPQGTLTDVFRDRLMIPIQESSGFIVAFIGRAGEHARPSVPKYLNNPRTAVYDKGAVLFGLSRSWQVRAADATPLIVEGPLDVIAADMACQDRFVPVSPCGVALTAKQVTGLHRAARLDNRGVLVAFDGDSAGRRAAINAYPLLARRTDKIETVAFPAGHDPAQILRDQGPAALADALANRRHPLADVVIDAEVNKWTLQLSSAEGQIAALRAIAPVIAAMPPADVAQQVGRVAARLDLDHALVTEAVTDAATE